MRWLFLGLLIINTMYFVWSRKDFNPSAVDVDPILLNSPDQVRLISEVPKLQEQSNGAEQQDVQVEMMLLGGFVDKQLAEKLLQRLVSLDIQSNITVLESQVDLEYWVYLAPLASSQAAVSLLKEMQARQIDGYLITKGELANGVSLGMFAREDSALSVVERLKEAGYEPSVRTTERTQRLYWVIVAEKSRRLVGQDLLKRLMQDFNDMKHLLLPSDKVPAQS